jgi:hypothetical protein
MTDNPGKVIKISYLASLTNAADQSSFTAKNTYNSRFAKQGIWPFSDEDFDPSSVTPMEK